MGAGCPEMIDVDCSSSFCRFTLARWFLNHSWTFLGSSGGKRCRYAARFNCSVYCSMVYAEGCVSSANQRSRRGISVSGSMNTRLRLRRSRFVPKPTPDHPKHHSSSERSCDPRGPALWWMKRLLTSIELIAFYFICQGVFLAEMNATPDQGSSEAGCLYKWILVDFMISRETRPAVFVIGI